MANRKSVEYQIDQAEASYSACWDYLCSLKHGDLKKGNADCVIRFQPRLSEALFNLSNLYAEFSHEKKGLVERKGELSNSWFVSRMHLLSQYQQALTRMMSIGKCLGDSFVWVFYRNNRSLLEEHLKHEGNFYLPTGIGGVGELEFLKRVPLLNGFLVLYHGMTNNLRLGDYSLFDFSRMEIVGIGELKSKSPNAGIIESSLLCSFHQFDEKVIKSIEKKSKISTKADIKSSFPIVYREKLVRQLDRIEKAQLSSRGEKQQAQPIEISFGYKALEELVDQSKRGHLSAVQISDGSMLSVYGDRSKTLKRKVLPDKKQKNVEGLTSIGPMVERIINNGAEDNNISIGPFYYSDEGRHISLRGMIPLFWWPIKTDALRRIVFQDVVVSTIFNSSFIVAGFESLGYKVVEKEGRPTKAIKTTRGRRLYLDDIGYYFRMITECLVPESRVLKMIEEFERVVEERSKSENLRVQFVIRQKFVER